METYYVEKENFKLSTTGLEFFLDKFDYPRIDVSPHIHPAVELLLIQSGRFRVCTDGEEYILSSGDAILFRSNQLHRLYVLVDGGSYYVVKFSPSFIMQLGGGEYGPLYLLNLTLRPDTHTPVWHGEECRRMGLTAAVEAIGREASQKDLCAHLGRTVSAAQVLLILLRAVGTQADTAAEQQRNPQLASKIYDTIAFLEQHYAEDVSAQDCAERAGISYSYFSRRFKDLTGKSFKQYLTMVRLNHAEKELRAADKPITQIAVECGFNNVAYFSTMYKKQTGMSPSAVRE